MKSPHYHAVFHEWEKCLPAMGSESCKRNIFISDRVRIHFMIHKIMSYCEWFHDRSDEKMLEFEEGLLPHDKVRQELLNHNTYKSCINVMIIYTSFKVHWTIMLCLVTEFTKGQNSLTLISPRRENLTDTTNRTPHYNCCQKYSCGEIYFGPTTTATLGAYSWLVGSKLQLYIAWCYCNYSFNFHSVVWLWSLLIRMHICFCVTIVRNQNKFHHKENLRRVIYFIVQTVLWLS